MAMRVSGLYSGMDTESIISDLVAVRQTKVDKIKKAQTKHEWKQESWKNLNSKIYKLFSGTLDDLTYQYSYAKKTTKVSNPNAATVITKESAMKSVQSLKINTLASAGYMTGGKMKEGTTESTTMKDLLPDGSTFPENGTATIKVTFGKGTEETITLSASDTVADVTSKLKDLGLNVNFDKGTNRMFIGASDMGEENDFEISADAGLSMDVLKALGLSAGYMTGGEMKEGTTESTTLKDLLGESAFATDGTATIKVTIGKKDKEITLTADSKISDVVSELKKLGLNANYDKATNRMFIGASDMGEENDFEISADPGLSADVLNALGLSESKEENKGAIKIDGTSAEIELNGVTYKSNSNTFDINGLTITCNAETKGESLTLTTQDDTSGIYDLVKNFIKEYSSLINEMDKLYNADSAGKYEPLTDEEKDTMSESEVEKWEKKIKDSLLRRDSSLSEVSNVMKDIMRSGFEVNGKTMYLSDFGIETLGYFDAADNEKNAYHIKGDADETNSNIKNSANTLMAAISTDPEQVRDFFVQLSKSLKNKLNDVMKSSDYRSMYSVYDDKKMKEEYDEYTSKIKAEEKKLADYEDRWYAKFAAMEKAMSKMQSNTNAVTSMLGGL